MEETEIGKEKLTNLLLDPENPRLPPDVQGGTQKAILEHIARYEAVEDLMGAIGRNGFFPGEPLVVYRHAGDPKGKYRVIEGNRRLVSVLLLSKPEAYAARRSLRDIAASATFKPTELPVIQVDRREDALPYLGSRHIVGVKAWEPLQKARYMHQLFGTTNKRKSAGERYREVALRIGSGNRRDYIKKNLDALAIYKIIQDADFFGDSNTNELNFSFGVLYTGLDYKPISGFLGAVQYNAAKDEVTKENDPIVHPDSLKRQNIEEFYRWCFYKGKESNTVLGESRNLFKLAAVLRSKAATEVLRKQNDLEYAYEHSEGIVEELEASLGRALKELRYSNSIVANVTHHSTIEDLARQVREQATQVLRAISAKKSGEEE